MVRSSIFVVASIALVSSLAGCSADASPTPATPSPAPTTTSEPTETPPATSSTTDAAPAPTTAPPPPAPVTYSILPASVKDVLPSACEESTAIYNNCDGTPVHLSWTDTGTAAPKRLTIALGVSLFCADPLIDAALPQVQSLSINDGKAFASFTGDISQCTCGATMAKHSFTVEASALTGYKPGAKNELDIRGPNRCFGLSPLTDGGAIATITANY